MDKASKNLFDRMNGVKLIPVMNKYSPDQMRDDHGRFSSEGLSGGDAKDLVSSDGFSINGTTFESASEGFMVARVRDGVVLDTPNVKTASEALRGFMNTHKEVFAKDPTLYVGGWLEKETGKLWLEFSDNIADESKAFELGQLRDQISIFDVKSGTTIETGGTGGGNAKSGSDRHPDDIFGAGTVIRKSSREFLRNERTGATAVGGSTGNKNIRFRLFKSLKGNWATDFEKNLELLKADDPIKKYAENQPRDNHGRFSFAEGGSGGGESSSKEYAGKVEKIGTAHIEVAPKGEFSVKDPNGMGKKELSPQNVADLSKSEFSGGSSTATAHLTADGKFTPEREALHDEIINKYLEGLTPQENPTALFFGGGPGSGKSSVLTLTGEMPVTNYYDEEKGQIVHPENATAVSINPDDIKLQLPGIDDARISVKDGNGDKAISTVSDKISKDWADASHEESSWIAERIRLAAVERGLNVVLDTTGNKSVDKQGGKVNDFREAGYTTRGMYVMVTADEGLARAEARAAGSGRIVGEDMVRGTYDNLSYMLPTIGKFYDSYSVYSNMGNKGDPGKGEPIALQTAGNPFTVVNEAKYNEIINGSRMN